MSSILVQKAALISATFILSSVGNLAFRQDAFADDQLLADLKVVNFWVEYPDRMDPEDQAKMADWFRQVECSIEMVPADVKKIQVTAQNGRKKKGRKKKFGSAADAAAVMDKFCKEGGFDSWWEGPVQAIGGFFRNGGDSAAERLNEEQPEK